MKKIILQVLLLIVLFAGTWAALSTIPFVRIFNLSEKVNIDEEALGDMIWKTIEETETIVKDKALNDTLQYLKNNLCAANQLPGDSIQLYVIENSDVNAFALPNNRLVVYTGLIRKCKNAEELSAVMAHEIAHLQKKHVMKKLVKEAGIALIAAITGGSGSNEVIRQIIQMLSSSAYDRKLEEEADQTGAVYLCKSGIDPVLMANFFIRMSEKDDLPEVLDWISTHKDSKDRAAAILKQRKQLSCKNDFQFDALRWAKVQDAVK